MISLGIAGTAKNTGKTTTLQVLLENGQRKGFRCGITSIGYDGEWKDNVTGLPKPRIHVQEGMLVGVASSCIRASTCRIRILSGTGIRTALGEVLVGEVTEPGLLITAGPNKTRDLNTLLFEMDRQGCQILFVDGALNRIIPFSLTDGIILATGAARLQDIDALARDAAAFDCLFRFPFGSNRNDSEAAKPRVRIIADAGSEAVFPFNSLLTEAHAEQIAEQTGSTVQEIHIPGAVQVDALETLVERLRDKEFRGNIHISTPVQLIPGGDLDKICRVLTTWIESGGSWSVKKSVPLLAMTVNPFYPAYRFSASSYEKAYVNAEELIRAVRSKVSVPVFDIKVDGSELLWDIILAHFCID